MRTPPAMRTMLRIVSHSWATLARWPLTSKNKHKNCNFEKAELKHSSVLWWLETASNNKVDPRKSQPRGLIYYRHMFHRKRGSTTLLTATQKQDISQNGEILAANPEPSSRTKPTKAICNLGFDVSRRRLNHSGPGSWDQYRDWCWNSGNNVMVQARHSRDVPAKPYMAATSRQHTVGDLQ
ncbi:hypothetical protein BDZ45DRAFT_35334 [Acephala macrosclerotiorum]|nr:hypothetical protein BDZ45DRAFT_35334 [Acephala macrosclerotiorum]